VISKEYKLSRPKKFVITDLRFNNELEAVKIWEFLCGASNVITNQTSENQTDDFTVDKEIINDGSFEDLKEKVDDILLQSC